MKRVTIDKDLPTPVEQFRMFTTDGGGATIIISKVKDGFRYEVIPTVDGLVGHDKQKDAAIRNAKAAGREMLNRAVNVRYKAEIRGSWPEATVTEVIGEGFTYEYDEPFMLSPRLGSLSGGQSYKSDHWELAPAQPTQRAPAPTDDETLHFLRLEAENMALSLESAGYGRHVGDKMCTPLERYRQHYPKGSVKTNIDGWWRTDPATTPPAEGLPLCPSCKSTATEMKDPDSDRWWIECDYCGLMTPASNFCDPREVWPTRPTTLASRRTEDEPSDKVISAQFHKIWTSQVGTEGYDKDQWQKLRTWLSQRGIEV